MFSTIVLSKFCYIFTGVLREVTTHFVVDTRVHNKIGGNHIKVRIVNPSGASTDAYITDKADGTYRVEYTAYEDGKISSNFVELMCHFVTPDY